MQVKELLRHIEQESPFQLQESYDNSGLLIGSREAEITRVLITLDVTEAVLDEAIAAGCNTVVAHHPLIFKGVKQITDKGLVDRCIVKAIKNDIQLIAAHTNLDNAPQGVNKKICDKLGLSETVILSPRENELVKLVVFVPNAHVEAVSAALYGNGAGHIGNYDHCGFNLSGTGTFRPLEGTDPYSGEQGKIQHEPETRIETILPTYRLNRAVEAMLKVHPYEEVAWDAYPLKNTNYTAGSGMSGLLREETDEADFLQQIKEVFRVPFLKHSPLTGRKVRKVAVCGGSGNFLIGDAIRAGADVFITGELKYHDYFMAEGKILLVEAGHYETEQYTKELLYEILKEKLPTFALQMSETETNPVKYL